MTDDPEDRPISFTLGHDLTRLVLAAYQRDGIGESTAVADIETHHPGGTLLRCLPAILESLHILAEGTPLVVNGGIDVLREQLAQNVPARRRRPDSPTLGVCGTGKQDRLKCVDHLMLT